MERFALGEVTEGVLFLEDMEGELMLIYHNEAASNILGSPICEANWLSAFSCPSKFIHLSKECLTKKQKISDYLEICKEEQIIYFSFSPFEESKIVISFQSLQFMSLQPLLSAFQELHTSVVEYHPEQKDIKYLAVSQACSKKLQRDQRDVIGKFAAKEKFYSQGVVDQFGELISSLSKKYECKQAQVRVDFQLEPTVFNASAILLDNSGEYKVALLQGTDVTAEKGLEQRLEDRKRSLIEEDEIYRLLRSMFEVSEVPMGISCLVLVTALGTIEVTPEGNSNIVLMNPAARRTSNNNLKDALQTQCDLQRHFSELAVSEFVQRAKLCEKSQSPVRYEGPALHGRLYTHCIFQNAKNQFSFVSLDITERKLLEEELKKHKEGLEELVQARTKELEEALQVKSRFLATMSHELRTPIAGITGAIQILKDTSLTRDQREIIDIASVSSQQLLTVINDILDLSKLEASKMVLEEITTDVYDVVENSIEVVNFDAEKRNIEVLYEVNEKVPSHIIGDPIRMRQILVNLLTNAVKFSYKGRIIITIDSKQLSATNKHEIRFCVKDEGIGIAPEAVDSLFKPFTQADSSMNRKFGGTGLGLSICKKLCELMGGKIWAESELHQGSKFCFTIVAEESKVDISQTFKEVNGKHILIINNPIGAAGFSLLQKIIHCHLVTSVEEAVDFMKENTPDFILFGSQLNVDVKLFQEWVSKYQLVVIGTASHLSQFREFPNIIKVREPVRLKKFLSSLCYNPSPIPSHTKRTRSIRILLAEDNYSNQLITRRMLRNFGYERLDIVENGKLAVEKVKEGNVDIVLMDVMMPEMGGIEATAIIRKLDIKQPYIIALTADVFVRSRSFEFDDIMLKPINSSKLSEVLEKFDGPPSGTIK